MARRLFGLVALLSTLVLAGCCGTKGPPANGGMVRFAKVNDGLYRGGQPGSPDLKTLQRLGIKTIVNLRMSDDAWSDEATEARAAGILYTNFPMSGLGRPSDDQVRQVLDVLETAPRPVFIHCRLGRDRTGTIIACYRIQHDQWTCERALAEASHFGMSGWMCGMRNCIREFAQPPNQDAQKLPAHRARWQ